MKLKIIHFIADSSMFKILEKEASSVSTRETFLVLLISLFMGSLSQ